MPTKNPVQLWSGCPSAKESGAKAGNRRITTGAELHIDRTDAAATPPPASTTATKTPARARARNHNAREQNITSSSHQKRKALRSSGTPSPPRQTRNQEQERRNHPQAFSPATSAGQESTPITKSGHRASS
jgi:hypothetical protein